MKQLGDRYLKTSGLAALVTLGFPLLAQGQEGASAAKGTAFTEEELLMGLALFLAAALIFAVFGLLLAVIGLGRVMTGKALLNPTSSLDGSEAQEERSSFWQTIQQKLTNAVPVEQEEAVMTDHEYDGIRELDNSLPPWWKALFYATIVFSVVYLAAYHVFGWGQLQDEEYYTEIAQAKAEVDAYMASKGGALNETNVTFIDDEAAIAEGKSIYTASCTPCHGAELQGTVGPNLVDEYWLHGGSVGDIFKTIRDGVPSKGMISWKAQLSPEQIQKVSSYIISMEGTNPPNAKDPQGEVFER